MSLPNQADTILMSQQALALLEPIPLKGFQMGTGKALKATGTMAARFSSSGPATNKPPDDRHLLHRLCQAFPTDKGVIETALMIESTKKGLRCPASLPLIKGRNASVGTFVTSFKVTMSFNRGLFSSSLSKHKQQRMRTILPLSSKSKGKRNQSPRRKLDFQYPINIAINNGASLDVVQVLASAAPDILVQPEDIRNTNSLLIALQKQPKNHQLVELLLQYAPQLAIIKDHHGNTPLHWAIQRGPHCSLDVIQSLYFANPKAVLDQNFHGETPLILAQRKTLVPENVVNFLGRATTQNMCSRLVAQARRAHKATNACLSVARPSSDDERTTAAAEDEERVYCRLEAKANKVIASKSAVECLAADEGDTIMYRLLEAEDNTVVAHHHETKDDCLSVARQGDDDDERRC